MRSVASATEAGFGPPFSLRAHLPFLALAAAVLPALLWFAAGPDLATLNDDSFTYLTLARWIAGDARFLPQWVAQQTHFPPLFPLLLVATGGAYNYAIAHAVVAVFAWLALFVLYGFGSRVLASRAAACLVVAAFLLTPSAWMSVKGVLSESTYLTVMLAALWYHAARIDERTPAAREALVFGLALAAAYMVRSAAITLLAGYAIHVAWRFVRRRERSATLLLPYFPVAACVLAWAAVRPGAGSAYWAQAYVIGRAWVSAPGETLHNAWNLFFGGWISSFQGGTVPGPGAEVVFAATGLVALAGTLRRALRNRLDGWYVLCTLALTFYWPFPQDTTRRLLYPVLPLLLLHAADALRAAGSRLRMPARRALLGGAAALPMLLCLPALWVGAEKAADRTPVAGTPYAYSDIADYYRFVEPVYARQVASMQIVTLGGLRALDAYTPPGARVMWMRPEYVALLSSRTPVTYLYNWDELTLAREIRRTRAGYVISSSLYKVDLEGMLGQPWVTLKPVWTYADPVFTITNPESHQPEFILLKVDPERLERFIAEHSPARPG